MTVTRSVTRTKIVTTSSPVAKDPLATGHGDPILSNVDCKTE
uniref:Uncharacterized protein n=1 Tax=Anguilla anguilla TaxID=7936 RepID=A0A0E9VYK3_ANGAN